MCYESDGHAKDESHEMHKVVMKMWRAVDAARWTRTDKEALRSVGVHCPRQPAVHTAGQHIARQGQARARRAIACRGTCTPSCSLSTTG